MEEPYEIEVHLVGKLVGKMPLAIEVNSEVKHVFKGTGFKNFDWMQMAQDRIQLRPIVNSNKLLRPV
jgi:hypothetical protein